MNNMKKKTDINSTETKYKIDKMTVLIIYNSSYVCASFARYLSRVHDVSLLNVPFDADGMMSIIEKRVPDVIITDPILMEDKGYRLLTEIKRRASSTKLIVVSIFEFPQYRRECLNGGADYYFKLPEELDRFRATMSRLADAEPSIDSNKTSGPPRGKEE